MEPPLFINHLDLGFWDVPAVIIYTWVTMALLIGMGLVIRGNMRAIPGQFQNVVEFFVGSLRDFTVDTMGPKGMGYFSIIGTAALFILVCNLMGLVPGFESATSNLNTTVACSLVVIVATHIVGVYEHGFKYIKHFLGPVKVLIPLMFPIEVIGHIARLVSLSLRLFGNIRGEDLVIVILFLLVPYMIPSIMMGLAVFTSFVQTFVFVLLAMLYISGAIEEAH